MVNLAVALAAVPLPVLVNVSNFPLSTSLPYSPICPAVSVFFARGTGEPGTNGAIVGPKLQSNLQQVFGGAVSYTAIPYAASAGGNVPGGQGPGTNSYIQQITAVTQKCPDTKVVITGYSQGAILVHSTANQYGKPIAAAVTFGDPQKGQTPKGVSPGNFKTFCAQGDPVCLNGGNVAAHLSYGNDAPAAAQFIKQATSGAGAQGGETTTDGSNGGAGLDPADTAGAAGEAGAAAGQGGASTGGGLGGSSSGGGLGGGALGGGLGGGALDGGSSGSTGSTGSTGGSGLGGGLGGGALGGGSSGGSGLGSGGSGTGSGGSGLGGILGGASSSGSSTPPS